MIIVFTSNYLTSSDSTNKATEGVTITVYFLLTGQGVDTILNKGRETTAINLSVFPFNRMVFESQGNASLWLSSLLRLTLVYIINLGWLRDSHYTAKQAAPQSLLCPSHFTRHDTAGAPVYHTSTSVCRQRVVLLSVHSSLLTSLKHHHFSPFFHPFTLMSSLQENQLKSSVVSLVFFTLLHFCYLSTPCRSLPELNGA